MLATSAPSISFPSDIILNGSSPVSLFLECLTKRHPELNSVLTNIKNWCADAKNVLDLSKKSTADCPPVWRLKVENLINKAMSTRGIESRMNYRDNESQLMGIGIGRPLFVFDYDYAPPTLSLFDTVKMGFEDSGPVPEYLPKLYKSIEHRATDPGVQASAKAFNITNDEILAILFYTADCSIYNVSREQSLYYMVNKVLALRRVSQAWKPYLYHLLRGLDKIPNYEGWSYRVLNSKLTAVSKQYFDRNTVVWVAFSSSTKSVQFAQEFANTGGGLGTMMRLKVLNGKILGNITMFPTEEEVLILPNSKFLVEEVATPEIKQFYFCSRMDADIITLSEQPTENNTLFSPNPFLAARDGKLEQLKVWREQHRNEDDPLGIIDKERNNSSLLYTASRFGHVDVVKYLLAEKADLKVVQAHKSTALHGAAFFGHLDVVKVLVEAGIDVGAVNNWGATALDEAAQSLQQGGAWKEIVEYLQEVVTSKTPKK